MDNICKNCNHWEAPTKDERNPEYGSCLIFESDGGSPVDPKQLAYASDGDANYAVFRTKPEFGCNQFHAKQ